MANQLTDSGLTVGSGTITNFIPAFGSNVIGSGAATVSVPSSDRSIPSSPTLGTVYAFNVGLAKNVSAFLPSAGIYCYTSATAENNKDSVPPASTVAGSYNILPGGLTAGGTMIASGNFMYNTRVGGDSSESASPRLFFKGGGINGYLFNNGRTKGRLQDNRADERFRDLSDRNGNRDIFKFWRPFFSWNLGYLPIQWQLGIYGKYHPVTYRLRSCNPYSLTSLSKEVA